MELKFKKKSVAIVIPMFNEEKIASLCIESVIKEISKLKNKTILIVIDDGSKDETPEILLNKKSKFKDNMVVIIHKKNKGYGAAIQTGINYAIKKGYKFYLSMDSDLTNPPEFIPKLVKAIIGKNVDCVKASRYTMEGKVVNVSFFRQSISIIGNKFASWFFNVNIKDCTNGFKIVRLALLKNVKFKENNFSIILEEMYHLKKMGAKFTEIPNVLYARINSKSHFIYNPEIFFDYFKYLIKALLLRFR